jgi:hypothetical protein
METLTQKYQQRQTLQTTSLAVDPSNQAISNGLLPVPFGKETLAVSVATSYNEHRIQISNHVVLLQYLYRWYILIVSIVVLPLSWDIAMGCTMILAGRVDESHRELQGFGLFSRAIYDDEDGSFLGCVGYSQSWSEYTNDNFFKVGRAFGAFLAAATTLSSLICLLVQCFNKHGKSSLWGIMRWSYALAFVSQVLTFAVWYSDICDKEQCVVGPNGVKAMVNGLLLFGMAVASFNSLPPRNPVFRLWNIIPTEYETDDVLDTDDDHSVDPENPRRNRAELAQILEETDEENDAQESESVSLFGSLKSGSTRGSSRPTSSSVKSGGASPRSGSVGSRKSNRSGSVKSSGKSKSKKDAPSVGSGKGSVRSDAGSKSEDRSKKSERTEKTSSSSSSVTSKKTDPSVSGSKTGSVDLNSKEERSVKSTGNSKNESTNQSRVQSGSTTKSKSNPTNTSDNDNDNDIDDDESVGFQLEMLGRSTVLGPGGIRISESRVGNKLEIVDEYPAAARGEGLFVLADIEGTDIVKVRTEYCPEGRKTSKEIVHNDGSRTITTLLDPMTLDLGDDL